MDLMISAIEILTSIIELVMHVSEVIFGDIKKSNFWYQKFELKISEIRFITSKIRIVDFRNPKQ